MSSTTYVGPKDVSTRPSARSGKDLPTWRKYLILFVVSWMTLCVTFSSTSLLIATPEISTDLSTTTEIINVTNAAVLIAMGLSSLIWSPLSDIFGRRVIYNIAIFFLFVPSIGTALAPNMATFTAMRMVSGFTGTYFMVAGQTVIADIFEPVSSQSARTPIRLPNANHWVLIRSSGVGQPAFLWSVVLQAQRLVSLPQPFYLAVLEH